MLDEARGCLRAGSTCEPASSQTKTPLSMPSTACSTQIVTASGSQTSRPAIRYFFTAVVADRVGGRGASRAGLGGGGCAPATGAAPRPGAGAARLAAGAPLFARRRRSAASLPSPPARTRPACRRRVAASPLGRLARLLVAAEIGDVPARALELEARGRDLLDERRLRRRPGRRSAADRKSSAARPARGRRSRSDRRRSASPDLGSKSNPTV